MSLTLILIRLSSVNLEVGRLGPTCESEKHKHIRHGVTHIFGSQCIKHTSNGFKFVL